MNPAAQARSAPAWAGAWPGMLLFVLAVVAVWSALPALLQTVPHADNVEQLNWAHHLQWGYVKHPPLPTSLLWLGLAVAGPSAYLTYLLAMLCVGATLLLLWQCARLLLAPPGAAVALLISSADYYLMGRGSFLNHNTVMLPFVAASAWAVLQLVRSGTGARQWHWWLLLGLSQALGMLTKYQMAIVIAANALALLLCYPWRSRGRRLATLGHVALCSAASTLPLLPHLLWLQQHDFSSFSYAGQNLLADLPPLARLQATLSFIAQQLGRLAPAGLALGLALLWERRRLAQAGASNAAPPLAVPVLTPPLRRALALLALVPVGIVLALALLAGVAPQNHWGASSTLLLPLLAVVLLAGPGRPALLPALAATLAVQAAAIGWNIVAARTAPGFHHQFAARPLAAMSLAHWQQHASGPLAIIAGPDWDAGALSLELPSHPDVLASGDRRQAPWISDARIAACGVLVVWRTGQDPAAQVGPELARRIEFPVVLETRTAHGISSSIGAGIVPPTQPGCGATEAP